MPFVDRNEVLAHVVFTATPIVSPVPLPIPPGAAYMKVWFNPTGALGIPQIAINYGLPVTVPSAINGIVFSDLGGYIVIELTPNVIASLQMITLDGNPHDLQVYFHRSGNT